MKKYSVLFFVCLFVLRGKAQLPVSTLPQNKKAVIEHFTAMNCQFSSDGDLKAAQIYTNDPSNTVLIQIHNGPWATPSVVGTPSYVTSYGNAIGSMPGLNLTGWPAATVNRTVMPAFSQNTTTPGMAQHRQWWDTAAKIIKAEPAYCNIALQGTVDVNTRVLTVEAEVYYTGNSPVSTNSLHIVLLEDSVHGPIFNPFKWFLNNYNPDSTYNHNHLLRAGLTPSYGLTIPVTTAGTTFSTTTSYTIPLLFGTGSYTNQCFLGRLKLAAFVTETHSTTINAAKGPIQLSGIINTLDIATNNLKTDLYVCSGNNFGSSFNFINYGSAPVSSAVLSYSVNGTPISTYTWSGFPVGPYQVSQTISSPSISFSPVTNNTIQVDVVSVNGSGDQNLMNNIATKTVAITPYTANSVNMTMNFNQDKYGSEVGWVVYDESTWIAVPGASIAAGTYTDLAFSGTLLHTHNFTVNPANCYRLVVTDTYGDGVNAGWGSGNYNVVSASVILFNSNGQYGRGESKWFNTSVSAGITAAQMYVNAIDIFPNPATTNTQLEIDLQQNEILTVSVVNSLGQQVYVSASKEYAAGRARIDLNTSEWNSGMYNITVSSSKGSVSRKLVVE